mmetsp:Transcript_21745/g.55309  ORF Transcript_21745/g.55309 Transcript_21745/m.55309 type:complete len:204 (-) Transcript_21745:11-622(-)
MYTKRWVIHNARRPLDRYLHRRGRLRIVNVADGIIGEDCGRVLRAIPPLAVRALLLVLAELARELILQEVEGGVHVVALGAGADHLLVLAQRSDLGNVRLLPLVRRVVLPSATELHLQPQTSRLQQRLVALKRLPELGLGRLPEGRSHLHVGSLHVKLGKLQLRAHRTGERRGASQGQPAGLETKRVQGERQHLVGAALRSDT